MPSLPSEISVLVYTVAVEHELSLSFKTAKYKH